MDGDQISLRTEFEWAMKRATQLKVELDQAEGRLSKTEIPHYSVIEDAAHEVGQMLSRMVQEKMLHELVAAQSTFAKCPGCGTRCSLDPRQREVLSGDGRVQLQELVGSCPACRRDFFPLT
jgi:hypothetical protein